MSTIKAIIFDMDGVLIDAKEWHYVALNRALNLFGMEISRYEHLVTYDGLPTKTKLQMLTIERGLSCRLHSFINTLKQTYTMELTATNCKPTFHHQYALARLKRENYKLAVASNSVRSTVTTMLTQAQLIEYIDFYLSNEDVQNAKPHPEIYIRAIERIGCSSMECLIVEDNERGVKAATASGAHLFRVNSTDDVTYQAILGAINAIEGDK